MASAWRSPAAVVSTVMTIRYGVMVLVKGLILRGTVARRAGDALEGR